MKKTFFRLTSVALVLLLLFAASGCRSGPIETPDDVKQKMIAMAKESLQEISFDELSPRNFYNYATEHDYVVAITEGSVILSGETIWNDFLAKTKAGEVCTVKYIKYHENNKNNPDVFPNIGFLHYDGKYYRSFYFDLEKAVTNDAESSFSDVSTWKYLIGDYSDHTSKLRPDATYYFLTNDRRMTAKEIEENFFQGVSSVYDPSWKPLNYHGIFAVKANEG